MKTKRLEQKTISSNQSGTFQKRMTAALNNIFIETKITRQLEVPRLELSVTWTRDSGRLIFRATSSLMKMSGYRVLANSASRMSSWARVKVVRSLRCLRGVSAQRKTSNTVQFSVALLKKCNRVFFRWFFLIIDFDNEKT